GGGGGKGEGVGGGEGRGGGAPRHDGAARAPARPQRRRDRAAGGAHREYSGRRALGIGMSFEQGIPPRMQERRPHHEDENESGHARVRVLWSSPTEKREELA